MIRQLIHRALNSVGLDLIRLKNKNAYLENERRAMERRQWRMIQAYDVKTVLDIGANEGQFAELIRHQCPGATIYAFEPLPSVFKLLKANFESDPKVIPVNIGLGEANGEFAMSMSDFSPSSSMLPMTDLHRHEWPQSSGQTPVIVSIMRLDDWAANAAEKIRDGLLVKMDVQGFELAVINGGIETIRAAMLLIVEVCYYELYRGQPLFAEIHDRLVSMGFRYRGNLEQHYSDRTARILFADAVFENMASKDSGHGR